MLPSGTLSFAAGETSKTITVNVAGDTTVEANEGFTSRCRTPAGTTIGTAAATGTILNDDALASQLSIAAGNASRGRGQYRQHAVHLHRHPLGRHHGREQLST